MELQFAGRTIDLLENLYLCPELIEYRKSLLKRLQLEENGRLLDLGIGTSANTLLILEHRKGIRITGVDYSLAMLRHSHQKMLDLRSAHRVQLVCMDAHKINFPRHYFDYAIISQVISYVHNPVEVLKKVRGCMKPSGKILLEDSDWESFLYNSGGKEIWHPIREAWLKQSYRIDSGRRLKEFAHAAGLEVEIASSFHLQDDRFQEDRYGYWLAMIITDYLLTTKQMTNEQLQDWLATLQELSNSDGYYFGLTRMSVIAKNPA
jgi:SAM-dependent methyltransferase